MLTLFNSATKQIESFQPINANLARVYCCGPTVYLFQHIGNFRTFIFEDILVRTLRHLGITVEHVMNITDVGHLVSDADEGEDKMALAAKREKKKSSEIAEFYTDRFFEDAKKLNINRPDVVCKATEHIVEMVELIKRIEANGFAYFANGNVYFDVMKFKEYGKMANLGLSKLQAGARIEVDEHKHSPFDFVLWFTKSKFENQELQWDSPWGRGYPGWHIECSAMSIKYLGEEFDIHCGGIDHIPVHHTNEIAQSEAATLRPWVKYWLHAQFLTVDGEKMSKSKGNLYLLKDMEDRGIDPMAFRFLCLGSHYRAHLNFSWPTLENAAASFQKLKRAVSALFEDGATVDDSSQHVQKYRTEIDQAIADDLATGSVLTILWKALSDNSLHANEKLAIVLGADSILGLDMASWKNKDLTLTTEISSLVVARDAARKARDFKESDRIRDELKKLGYTVEDSPKGTIVRK